MTQKPMLRAEMGARADANQAEGGLEYKQV